MRTTLAIVVAILLLAPPAAAQNPVGQDRSAAVEAARTMADGMVAGQIMGRSQSSTGSFVGGFAGGLLLGLIGTGIAYAAQGPSDLPMAAQADAGRYGSEYVLGLQQGFADSSKAKKRSSALTGGLLGTATLLVLVLSAGS